VDQGKHRSRYLQRIQGERQLKVASNSIHQPDIQLALLDVPR